MDKKKNEYITDLTGVEIWSFLFFYYDLLQKLQNNTLDLINFKNRS